MTELKSVEADQRLATGAYITWINNGKPAWRLSGGGMGPNSISKISARVISKEPMVRDTLRMFGSAGYSYMIASQYIIANLGLSPGFGEIDFDSLQWPAHMYVDWIRVYQHPDRMIIGCDPPGYPTSNYINAYAIPARFVISADLVLLAFQKHMAILI